MSQADAVRSFPRRQARTRRFTLGAPRSFRIARDGLTVAFLRSSAGDDPVQQLWAWDATSGEERLIADPAAVDGSGNELPPEERARRERAREQAGGIVRYATDANLDRAVFSLGGNVWLAELAGGTPRRLELPGPVIDPRLDPQGRRLAWVRDGSVYVTDLDGGSPRVLVDDDDPQVTWGLPEFIAAEEMGRQRGLWWLADSSGLLAARVDNNAVMKWHLTDPAEPSREPTVLRYPAAGTANADVSLALLDLEGGRTPVVWDREALPYLADVLVQPDRPPSVVLQSRDQRRLVVATVAADGACEAVYDHTAEPWIELLDGLPRWLDDGRLLVALDDLASDTRRLCADGAWLSPAGLQVRSCVGALDGDPVMAGSRESTSMALWRCPPNGGEPEPLTPVDGVWSGRTAGGTLVAVGGDLRRTGTRAELRRGGDVITVRSHAAHPDLAFRVEQLELGPRRVPSALILPSSHDGGPLPVLLDPYGGPHAQRNVRRLDAFATSQWFAEQGFAVLVADPRGTPARGPAWEHAVAGDLASVALEDQVEVLRAAGERLNFLDLGRVGIRGWSFGGYLAALAVLERPDAFHAAIAGAPVTDWRLYDTHYTERYLGHPDEQPEAYERSSLLPRAAALRRPLLLIHGLADDNVVAAHTLQLSGALLEAGRPHEVLPLSGVTHMTPQEAGAENLLLLQVDFLRRALGVAAQ